MVDMAEKHSVTVCHHHQKDASGHLLQSNSTTTAHLLVEEKEAAAEQGGCKEKSDNHHHKKVSSEIHVVVVEGDDDDQSSLRQRWKVNYVNMLTSCEMDSLTALCDTFLPSVQDEIGILESDHQAVLANFFRTSASMAGTPQYLGGLITQRLGKRHAFLVRLALFLLSTWIGTFILCLGSPTNLTLAFRCLPRRFSKLAYADRRAMLLGWSTSWIPLLRLLYVGSKSLVLLAFFTQVNSNNHNPTWDAIGYSGPDPAAAATSPPSKSSNQLPPHSDNMMIHTTDNIPGPLDNGIIDIATLPIQTVAERLKQTGFQLTLPHHQNENQPLSSSDDPAMTIRCDAVVVGSGSGGGVVAGLLAKAGYKVLILEKGPYRTRTNLSLLEGESLDQMYEGAGLLTTNSTNVMILAGSTVGGGSQVNWSASIRTPEHVIREWSNEHKLDLFTSERYREAMDAVCDRMGVQSEIDEEGFNNEVLRKGCLNLGYPVESIPRNSGSDHYCGWCFMGCKDGKKQGTMETWLKDGVESGNAVILPECEVKRVVYDKKRKKIDGRWGKAKGVMFEFEPEDCNNNYRANKKKKKKVCVVVESKVTVVACGALNTPVLLRRSGLRNSNIGKNLHLHPVVMGWGYFPPPPEDNNKTAMSITSTKRSYEGGIMTAMSTVVSEFNGTGYGAVLQTPSLHPGLFSVMTPWTSGVDIKIRMSRFSRTAHILALARDRGSGKVTAAGSPDIEYDLSRSDEESLNRGLEKILRVLAAAGAEEIGTHHLSGERLKVKTASEGEFDEFVRRESRRGLRGHKTPLASAHQMGSCRMGVDERKSVVDQKGETWEIEGLFVADTSVFPTAVGINPMVTVMAVAYCTAKEVMEVLKKEGEAV